MCRAKNCFFQILLLDNSRTCQHMNFAKLQTSDSDNAADSFPMAILILVTERKMVKIMCFHLIASEKM